MIGVIANAGERTAVEEFFQLFKTPWEPYQAGRAYDVIVATTEEVPQVQARLLLVFGSSGTSIDSRLGITVGEKVQGALLEFGGGKVPVYGETLTLTSLAGVTCVSNERGSFGLILRSDDQMVCRLGYNLFGEIEYLLSVGQPIERARFATADIHVSMLRDWMLDAGVAFVEIPPIPSGRSFIVCLTHDIDFMGIRRHKFDHTMWGFLYRASVGAVRSYAQGRISFGRLLESVRSVLSLPLVYLGLVRDFWLPFEWYLQAEGGLPATYYLIPFKERAGEKVSSRHAHRRACAYDVNDIPEWTLRLTRAGCELGVHGIDAWHNVNSGKEELNRIQTVTQSAHVGIRMHWLLHDDGTYRVLDEAGYAYDSTAGYNETLGYRNGTAQVFRPLGCRTLLELPLHVQDGALFLSRRLNLSEPAAWKLCDKVIENAGRFGGVITFLWHDRSHGPERFWGDFYSRLLQKLRSLNVWFATAAEVVAWFRKRREASFRYIDAVSQEPCLEPLPDGERIVPALTIRVYRPANAGESRERANTAPRRHVDISWSGDQRLELNQWLMQLPDHTSPSYPIAH